MDDRCDLLCLDLETAEELRRQRIAPAEARRAAERARALADPTRLTIATALAGAEELCVCDLAWIAERSQNLVSHHLKVLRFAGLVAPRREGKMVMYTLTDIGRAALEAVLPPEVALRA
jgi:DNA-binding transcriptional ArsR family regulator